MILVIDVGNTNIVLGLSRSVTLLHHWRVSTNRSATVDEYGCSCITCFSTRDLPCPSRRCHYLFGCSPVNECNGEPLFTIFKKDPLIVGPGIKTGLNVRVENPEGSWCGPHCNAVAALETIWRSLYHC